MGQEADKLERRDVHLLVVDDDDRIRELLKRYLHNQGFRVSTAPSAAEARNLMETLQFDLIVLDVMMPGENGFELTESLRQNMDIPIILLTAKGDAESRIQGLKVGADDYLPKPFEPEELLARLRALHRRSSGREHSAVILYGAFECHVKARTAFRQNQHLSLSPKEFELFRYFMENAGEIVTREMLLRDVWKMDFDPQTNVVDVNIGRLRRKLEEGFETPALETIWGSGYRILDGR